MRLVTHIKEEVPAEGWRIAGGKDRVQSPHAIINDGAYEYKQDPKFTYLDPGFSQNDQHPVVNLSWNDAVAFSTCERRRRTGRHF